MVWYDTGYTCAVQHTTIHSLTRHPVPTLPATYLPVWTVHSIINGDDVPCKVIPVFSFLPQRRAAARLEPADYPSLRGALVYSFSFPNTARSLFVFMPCLSACQLASSTSNLQGFSVVAGGLKVQGTGVVVIEMRPTGRGSCILSTRNAKAHSSYLAGKYTWRYCC